MKILVVVHDSNFSGGANRSLFMVLNALTKKYFVDVDVLLPKRQGALNKKLDEIGVNWFSTPYFGVVSALRGDWRDIIRYAKVYVGYPFEVLSAHFVSTKLKAKGYDLVYTNTRLPVIGAKIAKALHVPHVCHVRENILQDPLWGFWGYKALYDNSKYLITISKTLRNLFLEQCNNDYEKKIITIYNGIEYRAEPKSVLEGELFNIVITGRLVPDKCQDDAIRAVDILLNDGFKNIRLNIVGSSPKRTHISWYGEKLKDLVRNLHLDEYIVFHGEVSDMHALRAAMDCELMCAYSETFGRVTVEAMRSGLVVVGANTGATVEIVTDKQTGYIYEQGDPHDLAEKIKYIYQHKEEAKQVAFRGYQEVKNKYTAEDNVKQIYEVLTCSINSPSLHEQVL